MKRRLELPESFWQTIQPLPPHALREIEETLEHIQAGNPIHLIPFGDEEASALLYEELARYKAMAQTGKLCWCHGGGYRFYLLDTGDIVYMMAMEPRPDLLLRR